MTAYLSGLLAEMNGADLVACGILALIALWVVLWVLVTWAPVALSWVLSALARWHSRPIPSSGHPSSSSSRSSRWSWRSSGAMGRGREVG